MESFPIFFARMGKLFFQECAFLIHQPNRGTRLSDAYVEVFPRKKGPFAFGGFGKEINYRGTSINIKLLPLYTFSHLLLDIFQREIYRKIF